MSEADITEEAFKLWHKVLHEYAHSLNPISAVIVVQEALDAAEARGADRQRDRCCAIIAAELPSGISEHLISLIHSTEVKP